MITMPNWFESRADQETAINQIVSLWGKGVENVILSAPPGTGKSLMSVEAVRRYHGDASILYACTTKDLQDQLHGDYGWPVVKGRSNFDVGTNRWGTTVTAADCTREKVGDTCAWECGSGSCPYLVQRDTGMEAPHSIVNYAFMLASLKRQFHSEEPPFPGLCGRDAYIFDEADCLPDLLCQSAGVAINGNAGDLFLGRCPDPNAESVERLAEAASWACVEEAGRLRDYASYDENPELKKKAYKLMDKANKLDFIADCERKFDRSAFSFSPTSYNDELTGGTFEAISSSGVARRDFTDLLEPSAVKLYMSGSLRPEEFARQMNFEPGTWAAVTMDHPAPPANRVVVLDTDGAGGNLPRMTASVISSNNGVGPVVVQRRMMHWLSKFPDERVLIHHSSGYGAKALAGWINRLGSIREQGRPTFFYASGNSGERSGMKEQWLASDNGIMVAQSLGRGHDFADDKCRVQIIFKVAVPVWDRMTQDRMERDSGYAYKAAAANTVQQIGRVCRGADDYGITIILDGLGRSVMTEQLVPSFVLDALATTPGHELVWDHVKVRKS